MSLPSLPLVYNKSVSDFSPFFIFYFVVLAKMLTSCGWNDQEAVSFTRETAQRNSASAATGKETNNGEPELPIVLAVFVTKVGGRQALNITSTSALELAYACLETSIGKLSFGSECTRAADLIPLLVQCLSSLFQP